MDIIAISEPSCIKDEKQDEKQDLKQELKQDLKQELNENETIAIKTERLKRIKTKIENMDKSNQIGALYMISKNKSIKYSENNNGTFINLTDIDPSMLSKIEDFIEYIELQKYQIEDIEKKKDSIENIFFKQNKE